MKKTRLNIHPKAIKMCPIHTQPSKYKAYRKCTVTVCSRVQDVNMLVITPTKLYSVSNPKLSCSLFPSRSWRALGGSENAIMKDNWDLNDYKPTITDRHWNGQMLTVDVLTNNERVGVSVGLLQWFVSFGADKKEMEFNPGWFHIFTSILHVIYINFTLICWQFDSGIHECYVQQMGRNCEQMQSRCTSSNWQDDQ